MQVLQVVVGKHSSLTKHYVYSDLYGINSLKMELSSLLSLSLSLLIHVIDTYVLITPCFPWIESIRCLGKLPYRVQNTSRGDIQSYPFRSSHSIYQGTWRRSSIRREPYTLSHWLHTSYLSRKTSGYWFRACLSVCDLQASRYKVVSVPAYHR